MISTGLPAPAVEQAAIGSSHRPAQDCFFAQRSKTHFSCSSENPCVPLRALGLERFRESGLGSVSELNFLLYGY